MSDTFTVDAQTRDVILADAVRRCAPLTVNLRAGQGWSAFRSILLSAPSPGTLAIAAPVVTPTSRGIGPSSLETPAPSPGDTLGIHFRRGHKKCLFAAEVVRAATLPGEDGAPLDCLVVTRPAEIRQLQRRVFERAQPPEDVTISVNLLPRPHETTQTPSRPPLRATLQDISAGGMRVTIPTGSGDLSGKTFTCRMVLPGRRPDLTIEAVVRHVANDTMGGYSVGLQFVGLESPGRADAALTRLVDLVAGFQRRRAGSIALPCWK